jgi:hypothetical protein
MNAATSDFSDRELHSGVRIPKKSDTPLFLKV